jgi:diaminohydroxyphosphoribosylaminopyrimidine deaminase/5-amino-6-(5-phosphoribosylamino)uracil reductase
MEVNHDFYLNLARNEAWNYQGLTFPNPAVGCLILDKNKQIIAIESHHKAGEAHAEVNALKTAFYVLTRNEEILQQNSSQEIHNFLINYHDNIFSECTLYVTLEPCSHIGKTPSCANLIAALKIPKVFAGQKDKNFIAKDGAEKLKSVTFLDDKKSEQLLKPFVQHNKHSNIVIFKWAQRLDGTIDGGTISSKLSREMVHEMRNVSDLIVIGGTTLREDRPTLDARLAKGNNGDKGGKAPDVLIFSDNSNIDRTIPLFDVPNRKIIIANNFKCFKDYKNILIEGGPHLFEVTKDIVNFYLGFVSLKSGGTIPFNKSSKEFKLLHSYTNSENDQIFWLENK